MISHEYIPSCPKRRLIINKKINLGIKTGRRKTPRYHPFSKPKVFALFRFNAAVTSKLTLKKSFSMETPALKFARFVTFGTVSAKCRSVSLRNKANYLHAITV